MSSPQSVSACVTGTRRRLGLGESAVIIVIIVMTVLLITRGTPLTEATTILGSSGLLAVLVTRYAQAGPRTAVMRRASHALLFPAQA